MSQHDSVCSDFCVRECAFHCSSRQINAHTLETWRRLCLIYFYVTAILGGGPTTIHHCVSLLLQVKHVHQMLQHILVGLGGLPEGNQEIIDVRVPDSLWSTGSRQIIEALL